MTIYRLSERQAFDPETVERLAAAYEAALKLLRISNTDDPITEIIAQREIAQSGVRDPAKLCAAALKDRRSLTRLRWRPLSFQTHGR